MLQPNFDPEPTEVCIHRCGYVSQCKARGCAKRATLVAEKVDGAGRHTFARSNCARGTATSSSSASVRADLRSVIGEDLVDARPEGSK